MSIGTNISLWVSVFAYFGYILRSGIAGSYGSFSLNFLRNLRTIFHSGGTSLRSHQSLSSRNFHLGEEKRINPGGYVMWSMMLADDKFPWGSSTRSAKYHPALKAISSPLLVLVNKIGWEHSMAGLFLCCPWLILPANGRVGKLVSGDTRWPSKPKLFTIQHLKGKVCETLGLKEGILLEWLLGIRTRRKGIPGPDNSLGKGTVAWYQNAGAGQAGRLGFQAVHHHLWAERNWIHFFHTL